jgi:hypothetical protein
MGNYHIHLPYNQLSFGGPYGTRFEPECLLIPCCNSFQNTVLMQPQVRGVNE